MAKLKSTRVYGDLIVDNQLTVGSGNVTAGKIGNGDAAYTQISQSKSYTKTILSTQWGAVDLKYPVSIPGLKDSDTIILDGNNEIFAEYGLDATIVTGTLIFSVGVKPSSSITIKYSIIKTGSGT